MCVQHHKKASIDFHWGYGSPGAGIPGDGFSARWTRTVPFESGLYRFAASTDDGVRLWVRDRLLIDSWKDQVATLYSGPIQLEGEVPIKMEYYENTGVAAARLTWTRVSDEPSPPGVIVVVDDDPCFVRGGLSTAWHAAEGGYEGSVTWTRNNNRPRFNYNWARWYPDLQQGRYEVLVYVPEYHATTGNALYWVAHYDGYTLRRVNQAANGGRWVSLGTYRFQGTKGEYLSLADVTYEPYLSREIAFDATKWVPR